MDKRFVSIMAAGVLSISLSGCTTPNEPAEEDDGEAEVEAESGRPFEMEYEIRTDPERTLQFKLSGSFEATEDKAEAAAGETEIFIHTTGTAEVTNVSDGRNTEDFDHGFQLFLPIDECPNWATQVNVEVGDYCNYEMFMVEADDLEAGESQTIDLDHRVKVDEVQVDEANDVLASIMGPDGTMVSADRVFWNRELEELNPACPLPGGDTQWVTYVSESEEVNACSTEPDSS